MNTGGWADKLGNRYEGLWTVKQLLLLLDGRVQSVQLESVNDIDGGSDLFVTSCDGLREAQQCKKNNSKNSWTIGALAKEGVLTTLRNHLARDSRHRFSFISNRQAADLKRLVSLAQQFKYDARDFFAYLQGQKTTLDVWKAFCKAVAMPAADASGFDLLLRTEVPIFDDGPSGRRDVEILAEHLLDGSRHDVVLRLADFAIENMGRPIYADGLRNFLHQSTTFRVRELNYSPRIHEVIERSKSEYDRFIRRTLIHQRLIPRPETAKLLSAITDGNRVRIHCVSGVGGQGKSCVLHELATEMAQRDIPYLPLRFDQNPPREKTRAYGESLEFPESPVRCLHAILGARTGVVIIDQLDALRWTPQHHPTAWTVFERLVSEALHLSDAIHVVVACRSFDLEHEPQIRIWQKERSLQAVLEVLQVSDLPLDVVKSVVEGSGVLWSELNAAQHRLLQVPQNLYLWTAIANDSQVRSKFSTPTDLMRKYWLDVRRRLELMGVPNVDVDAALVALSTRLDEDEKLTTSVSVLERWPTVLHALGTLNVLNIHADRVRFAHQSLFDYYLAQIWLEKLRRKNSSIIEWLNPMDEQSLIRRGQLRQLLAVLRDDNPRIFLVAVRDVLLHSTVRFHLQHLTLQFLGHIPDPSALEVACILDLLAEPGLRQSISTLVLNGHSPWFDAFDARGLWDEWLLAAEPWKSQIAIGVLRTMGEIRGDRVAQLLSRLVDQPEPWPRVIGATLPWATGKDTKSLFDLRLHLVAMGVPNRPDSLFSEELAQREPRWLVDLLAVILTRLEKQAPQPKSEHLSRSESWPYWIPHHFVEVHRKIAVGAPAYFWEKLIGYVVSVVEERRFSAPEWRRPVFDLDQVWQEDLFNHRHTGGRPFTGLLAIAAGEWAKTAPREVLQKVSSLGSHHCLSIQQLAGTVWLHCPESLADEAICWLIEEPRRFLLGRLGEARSCQLAKAIISRHADLCSDAVYGQLENQVLSLRPVTEEEDFKQLLKAHMFARSPIGKLQHAILPALPPRRRSPAIANAIGQLGEKFKRTAEEIEGDADPKGGIVISPISARQARLSDRAWLRLIGAGSQSAAPPIFRFRNHGTIESSPQQFARDLGWQAERQPARFATLALKIPRQAPSVYWVSLLNAFRLIEPPQQDMDSWEPANDEQCCEVMRWIGYPADRDVAIAFCHCIEARKEFVWPPDIINILCQVASEHPHPQADNAVILEDHDDRLDMEALNTARGSAAHALATVLFKLETMPTQIQAAIQHLVADPVPGIRVAAIRTILPVLNSDGNQAVQWFIQACAGTLDSVLSSQNASLFITYAIRRYFHELDPILDRMERSNIDAVAEHGASWSALVWLHADGRRAAFEANIQGSVPRRKGTASVLAVQATVESVAAKCQHWLPQLFEDPEKGVRNASTSFVDRQLDFNASGMIALLRKYVASQAFFGDSTHLLMVLEEFEGDLRPLSQMIFDVCDRFTAGTAVSDQSRMDEWGFNIGKLSVLLLRLYGQIEPPHDDPSLRKASLDRLDCILRSGNAGLPSDI